MDILEVYLTLSDLAAKQNQELKTQELCELTSETLRELYNIETVDDLDLVVMGYGQNLVDDLDIPRERVHGDERPGILWIHTANNEYSTLMSASNIEKIILLTSTRLRNHVHYNKLLQCAYIYWCEQRKMKFIYELVDVCPEYLLYDTKQYYNNKMKDILTHRSGGGNYRTIIPERYKSIYNKLYKGDK